MMRCVTAMTLIVMCSMAHAADEPEKTIRNAIERGLAVVQQGARAYPSHQSCFSCHHQTLPVLAMTVARDAGLKIDTSLLEEQRKFTRASFQERQARLAKGEHIGGRAATVSYGLWTLQLVNDPPDELGAAMTAYLLSVQQPDGRWKPPSNRPPLEVSSVSCTVLSAIGIRRFAANEQRDQVEQAVARSKTWLEAAKLSDQEDLNFALWGAHLLGGTSLQVDELRDRVLAARHADGGWSQMPTMNSDAYATGQALFILAETGLSPGEAAFREGVSFLLETQEDDGSWHVKTRSKPVQPWFDNGDPHDKDQFISMAATAWATAALAKSVAHREVTRSVSEAERGNNIHSRPR